MINSPWHFEISLSEQELAKLGIFMLRWSLIEHVLANCLKVMLRLSDEEAVAIVFPMTLNGRINKIAEIAKIKPILPHAMKAFQELRPVITGLQSSRNNVAHAIVVHDDIDGRVLHLRSKGRNITLEQVFAAEELVNYAAHLCNSMRLALGLKDVEEPILLE